MKAVVLQFSGLHRFMEVMHAKSASVVVQIHVIKRIREEVSGKVPLRQQTPVMTGWVVTAPVRWRQVSQPPAGGGCPRKMSTTAISPILVSETETWE